MAGQCMEEGMAGTGMGGQRMKEGMACMHANANARHDRHMCDWRFFFFCTAAWHAELMSVAVGCGTSSSMTVQPCRATPGCTARSRQQGDCRMLPLHVSLQPNSPAAEPTHTAVRTWVHRQGEAVGGQSLAAADIQLLKQRALGQQSATQQ